MSIAKKLSNSCTAVRGTGNDAVLFSYSPDGFSSLALKANAEWDDLPMGIKVNGAVCVGTPSAFWVIGGNSPTTGDYTGLLRYDYASQKWSNEVNTQKHVQPFKDYTGHGAAYLGGPSPASEVAGSIILYGGSPGGSASSSTWVIPIKNTGQVDAYGGTRPAAFPIIGSWGTADVALVSDNKILLFNPDAAKANPTAAWRDIGIVMTAPPVGAVRAAIISGTDSSKTMLKFDLSTSPNKLTRVTLQDGSGKPMNPAVDIPVTFDSKSSKRDLTAANWPKYNGQPPKTTRANPAMAQSLDGQTIVFSGGASDSDPIAMFNAANSGWVDTAKLFDGSQQILQATSTSATSSISTSTSTSSTLSSTTFSTITSSSATTTASSSPTASFGDGQEPAHTGPSSNAILGITLGTIAAFLAVLGLILLCLRRHKRRQNRHVDNDINPEEKDTVAFAKTMQPAPAHYRGHHPQNSTESYSSVAILMGRMNQTKSPTKKRDSFRSSFSSLHKQFKSTISKPIPQSSSNQMMQDDRGVAFASNVAEPRPRNGPVQASDGTRRSSGWNKYWSGGSALQILGYGNKRGTIVSEQSSRYSENMGNAPSMSHANTSANAGATTHSALAAQRATQDSATVPPLNFEARPGVQRVVSGSPVVSTYMGKLPIAEGMTGTIERPISPVSTASGYSSGVPESVNETWDPTSGKAWGSNRASNQASTQGNGVSKQPQLAMAASSSDMSWLNLGDQRS